MFNEIMKDAIKVQIKRHPDYCGKFYGVEVIMSDSENNREEIISALKETMDQSIQRSVGYKLLLSFLQLILISTKIVTLYITEVIL